MKQSSTQALVGTSNTCDALRVEGDCSVGRSRVVSLPLEVISVLERYYCVQCVCPYLLLRVVACIFQAIRPEIVDLCVAAMSTVIAPL